MNQKNKLFKLQKGEIIFFTSGVIWLFSLLFLGKESGYFVWIVAKVIYFIGLIFFLYNFILKKRGKENSLVK